jgi:nicotinate dehydrogenase subunit B
MIMRPRLSRRQFLKTSGVLVVVGFSVTSEARSGADSHSKMTAQTTLDSSELDSWLEVHDDNTVVVYSGKVELGTGVATALAQIAAEELDIPLTNVKIVQGDTALTPDQNYTVGSRSIQVGGAELRRAAATARETLRHMGARHLGVALEAVSTENGAVRIDGNPSRRVAYAELVGGKMFSVKVDPNAKLKNPDRYTVVGSPAARIDIPAIATGAFTFIQDVTVPGMLHARVIRPPTIGAVVLDCELEDVDEGSISAVTSARVVRRGNFLAVVADSEWGAIDAARRLKVRWKTGPQLQPMSQLHADLRKTASNATPIVEKGDIEAALSKAKHKLNAQYQWPFQTHDSIGPSCAVADVHPDHATIWCASQGVYQLRSALADMLRLPAASMRVIFVEGAGCYGHNGADDAAADAALLSQAVGKPVRVQWMRHDEHGWNPKGPAMAFDMRGGVDEQGRVVAWEFKNFTPTHSTRPFGQARNLLAAQLANGLTPAGPQAGGNRNAAVNYDFPVNHCVVHWIPTEKSVLRTSALRTLGAVANSFANESFMDELAATAGQDPVEFRLRQLSDPRAIDAIRAAAEKAGWQKRPSPSSAARAAATARGRGIAFVRYDGVNTCIAVVAEVEVERASGKVRVKRLVVAHDCGLIINPDGLRNQIEGNVVQAVSRTLKEEVRFARNGVSSLDWETYPILTFEEVPEVEIVLINRPHEPALGVGEASTAPVPAAIANAIFDAAGIRLREVPFTPERVAAALAALR